jgi:hypothetical protein
MTAAPPYKRHYAQASVSGKKYAMVQRVLTAFTT